MMRIKINLAILLALGVCQVSAFGKKPEPLANKSVKYAPLNAIRFSPISVFYGGVGIGLSYERFIDKAQRISFNLPVYAGIRNYFIGNYQNRVDAENNYSFLINPGVRLYPRGHSRKMVYAIGPSVFMTYGTENGFKQELFNSFNEYSKGTEMRVGSMINNSLTFNVSPKINVGMEAGIGVSLYTSLINSSTQLNSVGVIEPMGLFSFQIGYKF